MYILYVYVLQWPKRKKSCPLELEFNYSKSPGTGVTDGCELLCGFWGQNPGPLGE